MSSGFFDYPGHAPRASATRKPFAGLHEEDWDALLQFASRRRYETGALIFQPGDDEPSAFFVISGAVRLSQPRPAGFTERTLTFGEGEVFGILTFLDQAPRGMTARAETDVEILMLSRAMFDRLASWQPRIALALFTISPETLPGACAATKTFCESAMVNLPSVPNYFENYTRLQPRIPVAVWRGIQAAVLASSLGVAALLLLNPAVGLVLFWGVFVPLVPLPAGDSAGPMAPGLSEWPLSIRCRGWEASHVGWICLMGCAARRLLWHLSGSSVR